MIKFFRRDTQDKNKCNHKYKEIGKYYTEIDGLITAVVVSECAICGERKQDVIYKEMFQLNYDIANALRILGDHGFCSRLEFMLNDYEQRKNAKECFDGESQKN